MPKRILSIDGGGVRGIIAIAFLEVLEDHLRAQHGSSTRIRDYFDLIGGTSTGAIIATALALGKTPAELKELYFKLVRQVFRRRLARIPLAQPIYATAVLERHITDVTGDRRLDTPDLRQGGLAIIAKRIDTGSVWFLTNNPRAPYWNDADYVGNRGYLLSKLVRASAAAPMLFAPQEIAVMDGLPPARFIDGSVSPHNNPALALLQIVTIPAYGYGWKTGVDDLEIVSVGTGALRTPVRQNFFARLAAGFAIEALESMIVDADQQVLTLMQTLGRCERPWFINSEIGDLAGVCIVPEPLFTFTRYNLPLDPLWLQQHLGETLTPRQILQLAPIDNPRQLDELYRLARKAAQLQVQV